MLQVDSPEEVEEVSLKEDTSSGDTPAAPAEAADFFQTAAAATQTPSVSAEDVSMTYASTLAKRMVPDGEPKHHAHHLHHRPFHLHHHSGIFKGFFF